MVNIVIFDGGDNGKTKEKQYIQMYIVINVPWKR